MRLLQLDYVMTSTAARRRPLRAFTEVFAVAETPWADNGPTGSKAVASVIKALVKNKYTGSIYPEHPRAMMQAALESV